MDNQLLDILVDPVWKCPLQLEIHVFENNEVIQGRLRAPSGACYPVTNGIPRFDLMQDEGQRQTQISFGFKWHQRSTYESAQFRENFQEWLMQRYGFESIEAMKLFFGSRKRILDAGCGSGFSSSIYLDKLQGSWIGVDISSAVDVAKERVGHIPKTQFIQADILHLPFLGGAFDTVYAEGVLHHTMSTERALKSLASLLAPGGEFLFYVYRKKAPIREFTDDYVRAKISSLEPELAWKQLRSLTRLGQALAELHAEVDIPEEIPLLGIKAGRYDVQRLMYWHFAKVFWNESFSFDENHHINFDWYHPRYAWRQTEEEIRQWCAQAGLSIFYFNAQESGFSVRATKNIACAE